MLLLTAALATFVVSCDGMKSGPGSKPSGPPKLMIVGGDSIAWGRVAPGVLKYDLKIVNAGGDTLRITEVHPSCGCTTAPLDKRNLGPGDTAHVAVSVDVASRTGDQHKSLTITSNDSTRKVLVLPLTAFVVRELVMHPEYFPVIDSAKTGVEKPSTITIVNTGTEPYTIQPPTLTTAAEMLVRFDMTAPHDVAPGDSLRVTAFVKPIHEGTSSAEVVFNTSNKNTPTLKASLTCNVRPK